MLSRNINPRARGVVADDLDVESLTFELRGRSGLRRAGAEREGAGKNQERGTAGSAHVVGVSGDSRESANSQAQVSRRLQLQWGAGRSVVREFHSSPR